MFLFVVLWVKASYIFYGVAFCLGCLGVCGKKNEDSSCNGSEFLQVVEGMTSKCSTEKFELFMVIS